MTNKVLIEVFKHDALQAGYELGLGATPFKGTDCVYFSHACELSIVLVGEISMPGDVYLHPDYGLRLITIPYQGKKITKDWCVVLREKLRSIIVADDVDDQPIDEHQAMLRFFGSKAGTWSGFKSKEKEEEA